MGKNKKSETLISYRNRIGGKKKVKREDEASANGNGNGEGRGGGEGKGRFYGCYLLTSLNPRNKGHTYIGFTVNPRRRIRQHNGETQCGARKTKSKRPWEMVLCIYGFPTNVAALQFEWAWQHPIESLAVRNAAVNFKSLSGIANKIKLAFTMLNLPAWQSLNLKVNFFSTKYTKHLAGCPNLSDHMKVKVCPMEDLPCYTEGDWSVYENDVWADEEECYETFGRQQSVKEGLQDTLLSDKKSSGEESYRTSGSQENSMEGVEGTEICDFNGCQNDIEGKESKEDTKRLCDLNMQKETYQQSFCLNESLPRKMCCLGTSFRDIAETIQDTNMLGPIKECNFKLDQMTSVQSQTPSVKGPIAPGEVEVIDVFTPSPGHTVGSGSKKRRVSTLCPEIIDLTMSPIFV